jgi:hypothetical protein
MTTPHTPATPLNSKSKLSDPLRRVFMPGASMTTYATNNPIGSMDPKDLFDNAQNLDFALNDITQAIWKDRFGRNRKTYWGMEQAFSAQLISQQERFNTFIQSSGYKVIGEYTDGPLTFEISTSLFDIRMSYIN